MRIKKDLEVSKYLIVFDLDGTLLDHEAKLTKRTIATVKKIIEMGNIVCIATGRTILSAKKYYHQLGLKTLMANLDGSIITNPSDPNFSPLNFTFSRKILEDIINAKKIMNKVEVAIVETSNSCVFINQEQYGFDLNKNKELLSFLGFETGGSKDPGKVNFNGSLHDIKSDLYSVLFLLKDDQNIDEIANRIRDIAGTLSVISWELKETKEIVVSITSVFASKLTALKYFSSYYGVKIENCIVFGDSSNDVQMLNKAGYSYAMKNGNMSAKLASKYITRVSNKEEGVALELEKLFGIENCNLDKQESNLEQ